MILRRSLSGTCGVKTASSIIIAPTRRWPAFPAPHPPVAAVVAVSREHLLLRRRYYESDQTNTCGARAEFQHSAATQPVGNLRRLFSTSSIDEETETENSLMVTLDDDVDDDDVETPPLRRVTFDDYVDDDDDVDDDDVASTSEAAVETPPLRREESQRDRLANEMMAKAAATGSSPLPMDVTRGPYESLPVTFADISRAAVAIRNGVIRTPCVQSYFLSELLGANIFLKTEFQQFTGSFKERGARNAILTLIRERGVEELAQKGVIAASAGNHALALAYHGKQLGVSVTVVMPTVAPLAKVDKCRKFGARVIIKGAHIGEAKEYAETIVADEGSFYINGYDDPPIISGAGTMGIEIIEDVPCVDAVVVPIGGAGLIAGVSCAVKTLKPDVKVYGVEPVFAASYSAALEAGMPVPFNVTPTLADGLAVPMVGPHAFEVARHYVDECVTCTEREVSLAILRLIENEKMVVEGGGATGLAALLPGAALDRPELKGKNIVVPLCGGNIDTTVLGRVLERGLAADDRLRNFIATVSDRPGGIGRLTAMLGELGASIKDIYHERAFLHSNIDQVKVKCVIELQGKEHAQRVKKALDEHGYDPIWDDEEF